MPRTKGSKNVLNAKELKRQLDEFNAKKSELQTASGLPEPYIPKPPSENPESKNNNTSAASNLKIKVPIKKVVPAKKEITKNYGCGNKLCSYESNEKFSVCPVCGVNNTWRTD